MRLIDADELIEYLKKMDEQDEVIEYVEQSPTVEQKHGEWIKKTEGLPHLVTIVWFVCSECGVQKSEETPFCPNCGARMGGDDK